MNDTVDRLTLLRHPDDVVDDYFCQDSGVSYISGPLDCDEVPLTPGTDLSTAGHNSGQYTGVMLVSISAGTVLLVATFILALGLLVGRRYWRRSELDYCKRRQSQLLQHDQYPHQQDAIHPDVGVTSSRFQTLAMTWLRRCWSSRSSMTSVGYRQVVGAELDVTSTSADVSTMTSSGHDLVAS